MPPSYNWVCLDNRKVSSEAGGLCGAGYEAGSGVMEQAVALAFYGLLWKHPALGNRTSKMYR